jgi:AP-4 complex subunit sigma-1
VHAAALVVLTPASLSLSQAHYILDEMVMNGNIVETNKTNILTPLTLMEAARV